MCYMIDLYLKLRLKYLIFRIFDDESENSTSEIILISSSVVIYNEKERAKFYRKIAKTTTFY